MKTALVVLMSIVAMGGMACGGTSGTPPIDGGTVAQDGGAPADGGVVAADGGAPADGGVVAADGGAPADGGTVSDGGPQNCELQDGGPCNSVSLGSAPVVTRTQVASAMPAMTGGTVQAGLYYMTAITKYTGDGGASGPIAGDTQRMAFQASSSTVQFAESRGGCPVQTSNASYTTSGTTMTMTTTCGGGKDGPVGYTASSTTLLINPETNQVATFTKQ